jgi:hypothetical protein
MSTSWSDNDFAHSGEVPLVGSVEVPSRSRCRIHSRIYRMHVGHACLGACRIQHIPMQVAAMTESKLVLAPPALVLRFMPSRRAALSRQLSTTVPTHRAVKRLVEPRAMIGRTPTPAGRPLDGAQSACGICRGTGGNCSHDSSSAVRPSKDRAPISAIATAMHQSSSFM